jgi:hypothetical protein
MQLTDKELTMRKLLQNTFFAAMLAWALQGLQAHMEGREGHAMATSSQSAPVVGVLAWQH